MAIEKQVFRFGSIACEPWAPGDNLVLFKTHSPGDRFEVQRADIEDLVTLVNRVGSRTDSEHELAARELIESVDQSIMGALSDPSCGIGRDAQSPFGFHGEPEVVTPMDGPDPSLVELARISALVSECKKSRRGVIIFQANRDHRNGIVVGRGCNDQPLPFRCDGGLECANACGKLCVHAEVDAIHDALVECTAQLARRGQTTDEIHLAGGPLAGCVLLHVKVVDDQVVAGGPPSCWQCSREILRHHLAGVWLFEDPKFADPCGLCRYTAKNIVDCAFCQARACAQHGDHFACNCDIYGRHRTAEGLEVKLPNVWRFYTAIEFHEATLKHRSNQLPAIRDRSQR